VARSIIDTITRDSPRWDAEYFANEHRDFLDSMLADDEQWRTLDEAKQRLSSGQTPKRHDLTEGDASLITVECVDPLHLDTSLFKSVEQSHVEKELTGRCTPR
jgi:hypothetical protein